MNPLPMTLPPPAPLPLPPPLPLPRTIGNRRPHLPKRTLLVLGALLAVLLGGAAPASAHAALLKTSPGDSTTVQSAPAQVTLTFSEGVLVSSDSIRVLGPDGKRADSGAPRGSGSTATVALHSGLPLGTFTVAWKVVSADSHPVSGAFTFNIGTPSKTTVVIANQDVGSGLAGTLYGIFRFIAYAGFALLIGASAFLGICWPRGAALRPMQRLTAGGWAGMVVSTIALLMLRGPYVNGGSLSGAFDLDTIRGELETKPGAALLSRLLLLAAGAIFMAVLFGSYAKHDDPVERQDLAWGLAIGGTVVAAGLAATWAMVEHASVGIQSGIAMPVDVLHLVAMALWLGGLAALLTALFSRGVRIEREAVQRFSRVAFCAVVTLVATGIYQSWRQLGSWSAFADTSYGQLLLVKVGLVALLLELAWFSRRWTARLADARPKALAERTGPATAKAAPSAAADTDRGAQKRRKVTAASSGTAQRGATATITASAAPDAAARDADETSAAGRVATPGTAATTDGAEPPAEVPATGSAATDPTGSAATAAAAGGTAATAPAAAEGAEPPATSPAPGATITPGPLREAQLARQRNAQAKAAAGHAKAEARAKARDADPERRGLRKSVLAEVAVAAVVLAVTTVLTTTQPGRADEAAAAAASAAKASAAQSKGVDVKLPYDTGGPGGKGTAEVTIAPASAGSTNVLHLLIDGTDGKRRDVPEVTMSFTLQAKKIGPLPVTLKHIATGRWTSAEVALPIAGEWTMSVTVRTSDIDEITETKNVKIS
ncbi:copper resistance protein CopC [Actinacidiphila oryziradicis]|uniref:copper resistance CopC/CopD family protein n=1 Tax=Actinacidiphila oryziradicis TaxID=2571141 RepID=UPI0023F4AC31|nr:copper resistance protein CopC [Actinacidiphila oryziradicis]MCW2873961.1 copper resistance protein CopC [Actinacidiphila oryziradicis]